MRRLLLLGGALAVLLTDGRDARAGGFETPDNGTEALGRGGAFVAKADDGTALQYNIAGLARQRGTRLTLDANVIFHDFTFARAGTYSGDPSDPRTPYAGQKYPTIHDQDKIFVAPYLGISTDLGGLLKRWTLGFGVYGPSSIGKHNFGVPDGQVCVDRKNTDGTTTPQCDDPSATVDGKQGSLPAPGRYDVSKTNLLIVLPTLAVAFRAHRILDVGLAMQVVYAHFDLANANITTGLGATCPVADWAGCDTYGRIRASGSSFSSSSENFKPPSGSEGTKDDFSFKPGIDTFGWMISAMLHPVDWIDIGLNYRTPVRVQAEGTLQPVVPVGQNPLKEAAATFTTKLPMWARLGARAVKRYPDGTERADVELDLVWENWSAEQADHVHASGDSLFLAPNNTVDADVVHKYRDTFGVRLGGAYTHRLTDVMRLTGRLGAYYDSSATRSANTRLDFDTFQKIGLTVGGGFKFRGFTFNLAYAYIYSGSRTVKDSELTAISATNGTKYNKDPDHPEKNEGDGPAWVVGNGVYQAQAHILSIGLTFNFSEFKTPTLMSN
ncbi:MAG: hypothetical protein EXR72_21310 [Myxococcales bacterium]|nr:hypothetical protein [Myxococcales bacterium]